MKEIGKGAERKERMGAKKEKGIKENNEKDRRERKHLGEEWKCTSRRTKTTLTGGKRRSIGSGTRRKKNKEGRNNESVHYSTDK